MDQVAAFRETLEFAERNEMDLCGFEIAEVNFDHLVYMLERIEADPTAFSDAKLGRWLGWAQCAVVAGGYGTLEDMKQINLRHAG
ncbi:hypothetical protein [Mycolicibacterium houstonense]|uniref:hypothetical protein n=1 Tax=Mycolicibacterium houstonense TaxID=146021 RepID=UPI00082B1193|nr:hypothetical protein [Mycolicibacterium houstonense]